MKKLLFVLVLGCLTTTSQGQAEYSFTGNAINDFEPGVSNGIVNGATLTYDRFGNPNSAYMFGGSNCNEKITTYLNWVEDLYNQYSKQEFTLAFWIYKTGSNCGNPVLIEFGDSSSSDGNIRIVWDVLLDKPVLHHIIEGIDYTLEYDPIPDSTWTFLSYSRFAGFQIIGQNGVYIRQFLVFSRDTVQTNFNLSIGASSYTPNSSFNGAIDDVFIWGKYYSISNFYNPAPTNINNMEQLSYDFYPNPATDYLRVNVKNANTSYRIMDMTGNTHLMGTFENLTNELNISHLAPGIYIFYTKYGASKFTKQ